MGDVLPPSGTFVNTCISLELKISKCWDLAAIDLNTKDLHKVTYEERGMYYLVLGDDKIEHTLCMAYCVFVSFITP